MRIELTLGEEPRKWQLELAPEATETQRSNLEVWLGSRADPPVRGWPPGQPGL